MQRFTVYFSMGILSPTLRGWKQINAQSHTDKHWVLRIKKTHLTLPEYDPKCSCLACSNVISSINPVPLLVTINCGIVQ